MTEPEELMPCPFCGNAKPRLDTESNPEGVFVRCEKMLPLFYAVMLAVGAFLIGVDVVCLCVRPNVFSAVSLVILCCLVTWILLTDTEEVVEHTHTVSNHTHGVLAHTHDLVFGIHEQAAARPEQEER